MWKGQKAKDLFSFFLNVFFMVFPFVRFLFPFIFPLLDGFCLASS